MITINCYNKTIRSFFIETKIKEPIYIGGVPIYELYLEKRPNEGHLYINGVRSKALSGGTNYQMIEPVLLQYFDEICQMFSDNTDMDINDESYLPTSIRVNGKHVFLIEREGTTFIMNSELGLNDIRQISDKIESVFKVKIIPLLRRVGLYG